MNTFPNLFPGGGEVRVTATKSENIAPDHVTLYYTMGACTFCFSMKPETARAMGRAMIEGADSLNPLVDPEHAAMLRDSVKQVSA